MSPSLSPPAKQPDSAAPNKIGKAPLTPREPNRPMNARGRLTVLIVTPLRSFPEAEEWDKLETKDKALWMPAVIMKALHELSTRTDEKFRLEADKYEFEWAAAVGGLCRARNGAVDEFQTGKGHFLLWWDSDLEPDDMSPADAVLRILSHRLPVVGGLYCKRAKRPQWAASFMPAAEMQKENTREDILQMAELAGGFKCFFWRAYSELDRMYPKLKYRDRDTGKWMVAFYQNLNLDGDMLSEDYWLDYLCRCSQVAIWADTKLKLRHRNHDGTLYPSGDFPPIQAVDAVEEAKSE